MENAERIINAINDVNKINWFDWTQLLFNVVTTIVTIVIAYLAYKLQKRTKADEDRERRLIEVQHISSVYYFLNDIIYKMADTEFDYFIFENAVVDGQKFMDDINYLRDRYITNQEFIYLREIYALYDGIKNNPKHNEKFFKLLYKQVIDINIEPIAIINYREKNDIDFIISIQLLMIMKKIERILNDKIDSTNNNVVISTNKSNISITKNYDKHYSLKNNNGIINGKVKKYEPVFHFHDDKIRTKYELVYEGSVKDNIPDGHGKYYYYTEYNGFNKNINSCDLNIKGINYDEIAQEIKDLLSNESSNGHFMATCDGIFDMNTIKSGTLNYTLTSNSEQKELKIEK